MGCNNSTATNSTLPQKKNPNGNSVLFIIASPMGQYSVSRTVGEAFVEQYKKEFPNDNVVPFDISAEDIPLFNASRVQAKFQPFTQQELSNEVKKEWEYDVKLIDAFKSFDKFVIALPVWNFTVPHNFKLYLDHLIQPGLTFDPSKMSDPAGPGLVKGKPVVIISSAGGPTLGGPMDYLTSFVNAALGFIGFNDIKHVHINDSSKEESKQQGIKNALELVAGFKYDPDAKPVSQEYPVSQPSGETYQNGNKVLYITSSPMGDYSASNTAVKDFIGKYKEQFPEATFDHIDLSNGQIQPFTALRVQAKFQPFTNSELSQQAQDEWAYTKELCNQFKSYDTFIFGVPMWNLHIPYSLKLYFDQICQPFQTFDPQTYAGLVTGKRAYVFLSSGSGILGTPFDHATPYVKFILGFLGFKDINTFFINGTSNPEQKKENISKAVESATSYLSV